MPALDWIGKHAVDGHHQEVPCHLLRAVPVLAAAEGPSVIAVGISDGEMAGKDL